jgi:hypothetical protein
VAGPKFDLGGLTFTWDPAKYDGNVRKHGITFEEAATVWLDPLAIERPDVKHSLPEDRWLRIGNSLRGSLLVVWSTERETRRRTIIRIIGARRATATERRRYEQEAESADE